MEYNSQGNSFKTADGFENIIEFLITTKIKLFECDLAYLKEVFLDGYLKQNFDILMENQKQEEKIKISEESKYAFPPTYQEILNKIQENLVNLRLRSI